MTAACVYDCADPARPYKGGTFCDRHAPQPTNPTPDPALSLAGIRIAAGIRADATFLPAHTVLDRRAEDSGRRVSGARRRAARDDS